MHWRWSHESSQARNQVGSHCSDGGNLWAYLRTRNDSGAAGIHTRGSAWLKKSSWKLGGQMSFHNVGMVVDLAFRRSRLDEGSCIGNLGRLSAKPKKLDGEAVVEVTNATGRSRIFNCNWLVFCGGLAAHAEGTPLNEAFPTLEKEDLDFLVYGITTKEWESVFGKET